MTKPGLSDNEQKIHDGIMGILDDLVAQEGGIVAMLWMGIRPQVAEALANPLDALQDKDDK